MVAEIQGKLWAVASGKGGVGKSVLSLLLGSALATRGLRVVLVDADLGGANLHSYLGIRCPLYTLADFLTRGVDSLEQLVVETPIENLGLICGVDDALGAATPQSAQKNRLLNHLEKLDADIVLLDLASGTSLTTVDLFLRAEGRIVVVTPQIGSVQNAYGFIKASVMRSLNRIFSKDVHVSALITGAARRDAVPPASSTAELRSALQQLGENRDAIFAHALEEMKLDLLVNMVREPRERNVAQVVTSVTQKYLELTPGVIGSVTYDGELERSINQMATFLTRGTGSIARTCVYDIASKIIARVRGVEPPASRVGLGG